MRKNILLTLFILILIFLSLGVTYSFYNSLRNLSMEQELAKFVFDTQELDELDFPLLDLYPGTYYEYEFSVSNTANNNKSDVSIIYSIKTETYHNIPLEIKINDIDKNEYIINCNEEENSLCTSAWINMPYQENETHNYKISIYYPSEKNEENYAENTDYLKLTMESYQKVE